MVVQPEHGADRHGRQLGRSKREYEVPAIMLGLHQTSTDLTDQTVRTNGFATGSALLQARLHDTIVGAVPP